LVTDVLDLLLLVLATFWAWETLRYALEHLTPAVFASTRILHPLAVAVLPLVVLWPEWVDALAVAGATGILVGVMDQFFGHSAPQPVPFQRTRRSGGLPPLP
jgi:membrane protein implicated in regulation of membrane protease activity